MTQPDEFQQPIRKKSHLAPVDSYLTGSWDALGNGAPVLVALAQIASQAMIHSPAVDPDRLSPEAKAILFMAQKRGIIEIKAINTAFDAALRILAVYVEREDDHQVAFRDPYQPEVTISFLHGFQELCEQGLVMHQLHRDFSLTKSGFALAKTILKKDVQAWLAKATDIGLHD